MNTMLNGNSRNLISQINNFKKQIEQSGKSPEQLLNDLVSSGKVSQDQLNGAINMAKLILNRR